TRDRRLAPGGGLQRVAQILWDVLQRPDVQVRRRVLHGVLQLGDCVDAHAFAFSAAARPARRPKTTHSSSELPIMRLRPCVPPAIAWRTTSGGRSEAVNASPSAFRRTAP